MNDSFQPHLYEIINTGVVAAQCTLSYMYIHISMSNELEIS